MELIVETEQQRNEAVGHVKRQVLPFTMKLTSRSHRTVAQNNTQAMWIKEIAKQWGEGQHTPAYVRAVCKLQFGVPILREEWPEFRESYDKLFRPMQYETKVAFMQEPYDFAVTRLMTREQKIKYLDAIWQFAGEQHWKLTDPDQRLLKAMISSRAKKHGGTVDDTEEARRQR